MGAAPKNVIEPIAIANIKPPVIVLSPKDKYSEIDIEMISAVVMHEVGNCSRDSKIAVTNLILNRLNDGRFGDTIYDVLHAKGQFTAIHNYYDNEIVPNEDCIEAVKAAIDGEDNSKGALYYCNLSYISDRSTKSWFNSMELVLTLDGQNYYKD